MGNPNFIKIPREEYDKLKEVQLKHRMLISKIIADTHISIPEEPYEDEEPYLWLKHGTTLEAIKVIDPEGYTALYQSKLGEALKKQELEAVMKEDSDE